MRGPSTLALVVLLAFSGCISATSEFAQELEAMAEPAGRAPAGFVSVCPPDGRPQGRLCAATISTARPDHLAVAVHPLDARRVAVALAPAEPLGNSERLAPPMLEVYVTQDGGRTWHDSLVRAPRSDEPLQVERTAAVEPVLAFDAQGRLHAAGLLPRTAGLAGQDVFHALSLDGGRTWSQTTALTGSGEHGHVSLSAGRGELIAVAWESDGRDSVIAWSRDAGATWPAAARARADSCASPSLARDATGLLLGCASRDGRSIIHGVEPALGSLVPLDERPFDARATHLQVLADGAWSLLVESGSGQLHLRRSHDGGATWGEPVDVRGLATEDDALRGARVRAFEAGAWGGAHVLLADGSQKGAHVALDPVRARVATELPLSGTAFGLAFGAGEGVLVWADDEGVRYTLLEPTAIV